MRLAAANSMNFAVGALWSEGGAGTNAIGTALAADHAVQVFAAEHFNEVVQQWTCAAAPVHDPETGAVLGIVDLTSRMSTVHPHSFAVAVATAGAVEAQLRVSMHERDLRMRSRYHDLVEEGRDPRALVMESGRVIASRPEGWTGPRRLTLPRWGGAFTLPSGAHAFAEPLDRDGAYLVRRLELGPGLTPGVIDLHLLGREPARRARRAHAAAAPPPGGDPRAAVPAARGLHDRGARARTSTATTPRTRACAARSRGCASSACRSPPSPTG